MSETNIFSLPLTKFYETIMNKTFYYHKDKRYIRDAFRRIAEPYSGAASLVILVAKLVRGGDFYTRFTH
ncbi:MAG: hypothetical protein A2942_00595 [Candidatus Lloydbacteria bacterium RIFCSPLOWO2_01_FULL_50_20]|uniref:Uncharacterized protein n=1 Tax=Candidatus Lloydbacteria bacterium RIFCSPLOWO2_01_FULL_50_20 TaxID=1798665 RepID=A0A1G2DER3_9BACT|nr:MAG: hypothetical protein A2942_00595 [Candidatus Lloydbacteria bacterium RIFCSPLOWO2_01_FULL_50_20]